MVPHRQQKLDRFPANVAGGRGQGAGAGQHVEGRQVQDRRAGTGRHARAGHAAPPVQDEGHDDIALDVPLAGLLGKLLSDQGVADRCRAVADRFAGVDALAAAADEIEAAAR